MSRIYSEKGQQTSINQDEVLNFFEKRAQKVKLKNVSSKQAVIYQDKNPLLAEKRDEAEKALLLPKLNLTGREYVLDIACGTGRWVNILKDHIGFYYGIDSSDGLIQIAKEQFVQDNIKFTQLKAENISLIGGDFRFDRILSLGLLIYLNEPQLDKYLHSIPELISLNGLLIIREPVALEKRLTLDSYFSEDMDQAYSAIYRTESELLELINDAFKGKLVLIENDFVFKEEYLNNRSETRMKYFIFKCVSKCL